MRRKFNVVLARKVFAQIEADSKRWNQSEWRTITPHCESAYCFAGWACILSGERFQRGSEAFLESGQHCRDRAMELLGMTTENGLFSAFNSRVDLERIASKLAERDGRSL